MKLMEKLIYTPGGRRTLLRFIVIAGIVILTCAALFPLAAPLSLQMSRKEVRLVIENAIYGSIERVVNEGSAYGTLVSVTRDTSGNVTEIKSNRGLINILSSRLNEEIIRSLGAIFQNRKDMRVKSDFESLITTSEQGTVHRLVLQVKAQVSKMEVTVRVPLTETVYLRSPLSGS
ncbi:MAG TPA: hypothetical protein DD727_09720 [Clostridiales bacterium]|nr:hypothetical protein [Clostridiales bacterium]